MRSFSKILLAFICLSTSDVQYQNEGWKLEKEKKGVQVFTKKIKGFDIKGFRAIGYVEAPYEQVFNVIIDANSYGEWYPDCKKGEKLKMLNDSVHYRRLVYKLPWPFDPRDVVNKVETKIDNEGATVTFSNASSHLPEEKGTVRISDSFGSWTLIKVGARTKVTYQAVANSGGIPSWIVNMFVVGGPIAAIDNLREMVKKPKYQ